MQLEEEEVLQMVPLLSARGRDHRRRPRRLALRAEVTPQQELPKGAVVDPRHTARLAATRSRVSPSGQILVKHESNEAMRRLPGLEP